MTDDDLATALARYRVPDASPDLADRVMQRIARPPRALHRGALLAGAALAVVAVTAIFLLRAPSAPVHGSYASAGRASLSIGSRAVAVAEDGTDVRWTVARDGAARVAQRTGNVFYRVEHGAAFSVETPAGTITVTGTCFRIEVLMPITRKHVASAAVGAAVAATVVVAVYEGGVRVVNARGSAEVAAGERIRMVTGEAPVRDGEPTTARSGLAQLGADATRAQLTAHASALEDKLAAAQNTITTLRAQLDAARTPENPKLVHPSKELLLTWAKQCYIHLDTPGVFGATPPVLNKSAIESWGIAKSEIPEIDKISTELHARARDEIRELYIAATNNVEGADELLPNAMISEIFGKASTADKLRTRTRLSRERAGLQAPPPVADMSLYERLVRLLVQLGNDYEQMIGKAIGADRALELRERFNSWPGFQMSEDGCDEHSR